METPLNMKQVAELTNVSLSAIRNRRKKAEWVWRCAINTTPEAKRPAYVWLESDLQKALNALRQASPAYIVKTVRPSIVRGGRTGKKTSDDVTAIISDLSAQLERNRERQRARVARREALHGNAKP